MGCHVDNVLLLFTRKQPVYDFLIFVFGICKESFERSMT